MDTFAIIETYDGEFVKIHGPYSNHKEAEKAKKELKSKCELGNGINVDSYDFQITKTHTIKNTLQ